jgi:hypothetical protein
VWIISGPPSQCQPTVARPLKPIVLAGVEVGRQHHLQVQQLLETYVHAADHVFHRQQDDPSAAGPKTRKRPRALAPTRSGWWGLVAFSGCAQPDTRAADDDGTDLVAATGAGNAEPVAVFVASENRAIGAVRSLPDQSNPVPSLA